MKKLFLTLALCAATVAQLSAQAAVTLWEGEQTGTTPWTKAETIVIDASVFESASPGDKLVFTVSAATGDDVTVWSGIDIYKCDPWEWKYWVGVLGAGTYTLELSEEHINSLKPCGCELDLEHLTLTKIEFVSLVDAVQAPVGETHKSAAIYSLSGHRQPALRQGINIVGDKKVSTK